MKLDNETKSHILQLQAAARENRLVIFVGAGASATSEVPIWQDLINKLKSDLPESVSASNDMLKIAQMYRELRGEVEYQKTIKRILKDGEVGCNQIHDTIIKLNPCHIVTTNYDDLLEQAALRNNKQYYVVAKDEQLPANQGEKMLIKMHGSFKEGNIVLTENDYFDYSRNFPLIRSFIISLFCTKVVLFVGFSFDDINLKYILREISSILDSKMQEVYLLVDQPKSAIEYTYFHKKGIQLLCLPRELTSDLLLEHTDSLGLSFSDERTIAMFQGLKVICEYDQFYDDLIARAINFLEVCDNQIRFWGRYLFDKVLQKKMRDRFYLSQQNLLLPKKYEEWFNNIFKTKESKSAFKNKYGDKLEWLINKLLDNKITSVNNYSICDEAFIADYEKKNQPSPINLIYSLAFKEIDNRLIELRKRSLTYTIDDLELPYLLFKLGKFDEAYFIYKQLAPEMWKHRKYILYFICLYNIKVSYVKTSKISINNDKEINLKEILSELPIDAYVKDWLDELVNYGMLKDYLIESVKLNDKLSLQRKKAEKGGCSINHDIVSLIDNFDQSFFFCNENYILNDYYEYWQNANEKTAEGIINSIMTPDKERWQTKLDKLLEQNILLFVFMINSDNLAKMLNRLVNKPIPAEDEFMDALVKLIENLVVGLENHQDLMSPLLVSNYLKNIILMLNSIENAPCLPNIYDPIIHYWYKGRFVEFAPELMKLHKRQSPSAKEAIKLIDCVLHSKTIKIAKKINEYISELAFIAKTEDEVLDDFISIKQITEFKNIVLESAFLWAIPEEYRQELIDYLRKHVDNIYDLCFMEKNTKAHIITPRLLKKLKNTISNPQDRSMLEAAVCFNLLEMANQEEYSELSVAIEDFKKINKCYQFISNPLEYNNIDELQGYWLMCITDENLLKELLNNKKIRSIATTFCDDTRLVSFKEKIWRLMK